MSVSYTINTLDCMGTPENQRELRLSFTLMIYVSFLEDTHKNYNGETKTSFLNLEEYHEEKKLSIDQQLYCI